MPSTLRGFVVPAHVSKLSHVNIESHTRFHHLDAGDMLRESWRTYSAAFEEVNALAVQRHLVTYDEFVDLWHDARIEKWTARDDDGALIGLGVQTADLDAWPLISPAYFERRWPDLYAERKIWYVGFVCTRQQPAAPIDTFAHIIRAMSAETRAAGGISVMDYCTANINRGLPKGAGRILARAGEVWFDRIDEQAFYAYDFGGGRL
jgi:hypothetical protein